jgi:exonuclease III
MINSYKEAAWNANGLSQRIKEAETFLNTQKIGIFLISETHFTERNYIKLPNYIAYDTKHPDGRPYAGTAILIRRNVKHYEFAKYETTHTQATSVCIEEWNGKLTV